MAGSASLKEKELRLGLVCYGGVSLAVYMHGITKEIHKLARASQAYHSVPGVAGRAHLRFADIRQGEGDPASTEEVYFDFLKSIGAHRPGSQGEALDLRVIVDVIAGASAGGINGIVLARALAHDLPIDGLREVWLKEADVSELLSARSMPRLWSKWFVRPFLWFMTRHRLARLAPDVEMRAKLSMFLRARWFRPPFDGKRLAGVLFDAIDGMEKGAPEGRSLIPNGHPLDLFVTITDFYGYVRKLRIHDPAVVQDREHRHSLHFSFRSYPGGESVSELDSNHVPGLIFAARATSSFPGAFPPAQIREIDRMLAQRGREWTTRTGFLASKFRRYARAGMDPEATSFFDGSVLNNKPFAEALDAVKNHAAYRDVDRRLVYIDPDPEEPPPPADGRVPGFFRTLKGALSDIPRTEPVADELTWIDGFNVRVRRMRLIIDAARPQVAELVEQITKGRLNKRPSLRRVRNWRLQANARAARETGFAYEGYLRLKLSATYDFLADILIELCGHDRMSTEARWIAEVVRAWSRVTRIDPGDGALARRDPRAAPADQPAWARFLFDFDNEFRRRRLTFVIRSLNLLYGRARAQASDMDSAETLDILKARLYQVLERIRRRGEASALSADVAERVRALFATPPADERAGDLVALGGAFAAAHLAELDDITHALGRQINANASVEEVDEIFASLGPGDLSIAARRELLSAYVGFALWDVLTFTIASWRDLGEFNEIRVDRISPEDAKGLRPDGGMVHLKGAEFNHFGAFFSRPNREHDYLWGRLHGADRLIDILVSAARMEGAAVDLDIRRLKARAFAAILASEEEALGESAALIARLRQEIAKL